MQNTILIPINYNKKYIGCQAKYKILFHGKLSLIQTCWGQHQQVSNYSVWGQLSWKYLWGKVSSPVHLFSQYKQRFQLEADFANWWGFYFSIMKKLFFVLSHLTHNVLTQSKAYLIFRMSHDIYWEGPGK